MFRFEYAVLGSHVHVRVFCNGLCGRLVMSVDEWEVFRSRHEHHDTIVEGDARDIIGARTAPGDATYPKWRSLEDGSLQCWGNGTVMMVMAGESRVTWYLLDLASGCTVGDGVKKFDDYPSHEDAEGAAMLDANAARLKLLASRTTT